MKFGYNRPSSLFEIVDGRAMDGRKTDNGAYLYYQLPRSLWLKWKINGVQVSPSFKVTRTGTVFHFP